MVTKILGFADSVQLSGGEISPDRTFSIGSRFRIGHCDCPGNCPVPTEDYCPAPSDDALYMSADCDDCGWERHCTR